MGRVLFLAWCDCKPVFHSVTVSLKPIKLRAEVIHKLTADDEATIIFGLILDCKEEHFNYAGV